MFKWSERPKGGMILYLFKEWHNGEVINMQMLIIISVTWEWNFYVNI